MIVSRDDESEMMTGLSELPAVASVADGGEMSRLALLSSSRMVRLMLWVSKASTMSAGLCRSKNLNM